MRMRARHVRAFGHDFDSALHQGSGVLGVDFVLGGAQSALIVRHLRQNQSLGCKLAPYLLKDFTAIASSSFTSKTV